MNRGIEQNIDESQFVIFSAYWNRSLNNENFQQTFLYIRREMISSISNRTTTEANALRTGMERVTTQDAFELYISNFRYANYLSNPFSITITLNFTIDTQNNELVATNRILQDQVANDNYQEENQQQGQQSYRKRGPE